MTIQMRKRELLEGYGFLFCFIGSFAIIKLLHGNSSWIGENGVFICWSILFIVAVIVFRKFIKVNIQQMQIKDPVNLWIFFNYLILTIFITWGFSLITSIFIKGCPSEVGIIANYGNSWFALLISMVIFVPIVEELIFLGVIFGTLRTKINNKYVCAIGCGIIFGLCHFFGIFAVSGMGFQMLSLIPMMAMGTALAMAYEETQNIWWPVMIHMFFNFFGCIHCL